MTSPGKRPQYNGEWRGSRRMRKVYSSQDSLLLGHFKNLLEGEGIECLVRNEYLRTGAGEIPPIECWLELWVADDSEADRARRLLEEALEASRPAPGGWQCPGCGEQVEGQFARCWNCGSAPHR